MSRQRVPRLTLGDQVVLSLDQPRLMGILNVTPDSFSDGGRHDGVQAATAHAMAMIHQGADIIDIGGESTRPGSQPVSEAEQIQRTAPVIEKLAQAIRQQGLATAISIDTTQAAVAQAAIDAGATILNDISAGLHDPSMLPLAARTGLPITLMHMQGTPRTMQQSPHYDDVVAQVRDFLLARAQAAIDAGVRPEQIILDPGIGFGKTKAHNLALLAHLDELVATGHPVLLGTSRKRFMGSICQGPDGDTPPAPDTLVGATCATTAMGVAHGVMIFRVHDVQPNRQAADVAWAIRQAREQDTTSRIS